MLKIIKKNAIFHRNSIISKKIIIVTSFIIRVLVPTVNMDFIPVPCQKVFPYSRVLHKNTFDKKIYIILETY